MSAKSLTSTTIPILAATTFASIVILAARRRKSRIFNPFTIPNELIDGPYSTQLKVAVDLALKAGSNMISHLETKGTESGRDSEDKLGISTKKNDADFCTKIDLLNEKIITEGIQDAFPQHEVIGEESTGTDEVEPLTIKPTWIVDPIDGTTNFASGCPLTCVSIGFCDGGRPVMGVVFSPVTKEVYIAIKDKGAYRNGQRIHTKNSENSQKSLGNAVVCFEFGYARSEEGIDNMVNGVRRILNHGCRTTRSYGSGVLDLCYVATGRIDVVYTGLAEEGWKPWDYCAAMVVAKEAGCTICSLKGESNFDQAGKVVEGSEFDIYSKSMICGVNDVVTEQCRKIVLDL